MIAQTNVTQQRASTRKVHRYFQVFGLLLLLIGIWTVWLYGLQHTLRCTHNEDGTITCHQEVSWLGFIPLGEEQSITTIQAAELALSCHTQSSTAKYTCIYNRVSVISPGGSVTLAGNFTTKEAQETVNRLNKFIQQTEAEPSGGKPLVIEILNEAEAYLGLMIVPPVFILSGILALAGVWEKALGLSGEKRKAQSTF